ncbi:MAG: hypothetical protein ACPG4W_05575 [Flavobacteriales bacterium]
MHKKQTNNFFARHWHWLGLVCLVAVGGLVWATATIHNCDNDATVCLKLYQKGEINPDNEDDTWDERESAIIDDYLDEKVLKMTNHTGDPKATIDFICTESGVCAGNTGNQLQVVVDDITFDSVIGGNAYTYFNGSGTVGYDVTQFTNNFVLPQGFSSVPTNVKWAQFDQGPNVGYWMNLSKNSQGDYLDTTIYESKPRVVFAPFQTEKELYKFAKYLETPGHELSYSDVVNNNSCTGTPTNNGGMCMGNDDACLSKTNQPTCELLVLNDEGQSVCQWVSFCVGDASCDGNTTQSACEADTYPYNGPTEIDGVAVAVPSGGVSCTWQPSPLGCSMRTDQTTCSGTTGCTWTEADNGGIELCVCVVGESETTTTTAANVDA